MTYGVWDERARRIREVALSLPPGIGDWARFLLATKRVDGERSFIQPTPGGPVSIGVGTPCISRRG